jgi:zinc protease
MAEVQAFASLHYQPANATIVISGRFDTEETLRIITRYFGAIPSHRLPARDVFPAPRLTKDVVTTFGAPVRSRIIALGWVFPPPEGDGFDEMTLAGFAIEPRVRARLLRGGDLALADEAHVYREVGHLGSMLVVVAKLREGTSADTAAFTIQRVMSEVATLGRTYEWEDFGGVRLTAATTRVIQAESLARRASRIQSDLEYAGVVRSTAEDVARVQRLQPWNVGGAVRQFIADAHHVVVVLEPDPAAPPEGARR